MRKLSPSCPASRPGLRCHVRALVWVQLFAAGQLWQGWAEVTLGVRFETFVVTCTGVAEADSPSSVYEGSQHHRGLSQALCRVPNGR